MKNYVLKDKIRKSIAILLILLCGIVLFEKNVQAQDSAVFRVQTAEVKEDGTINIAIYLTGVSNLGAVDAELIYDPEKVSYVDAQLGESLKSTYADIYHNEEKALIKYVALYTEPQQASGILMKATFQLLDGESYQPQLNVVDIVDNSDEIKDIPYSITYQQSDGTWSETPDNSEQKADIGVIEKTLETYGADADKNNTVSAGENAVDDNISIDEDETGTEQGNSAENRDQLSVTDEEIDGSDENEDYGEILTSENWAGVILVVIIAAAVIAGVIVAAVYKKKRSHDGAD